MPKMSGPDVNSPHSALGKLKRRLAQVDDLRAASMVLSWDQATHMPSGGATARGRQLATLGQLAHERFVDPEIGRLLDAAEREQAGLPEDSDDAALLRVARYDFEQATLVPASFAAEFGAHTTETFQRWSETHPDGDFSKVRDGLERTLELSRRYAEFFGPSDHPADPLIDQSDRGMTVARLRPLFAELRAALVPLVEAVAAAEPADTSWLQRPFPEHEQLAAGLEIAQAFGYDLTRGRQDKTLHPFAMGIAVGDVRITVRTDERRLTEGLYTTLHEAGHAMYEQGVSASYDGTLLAGGASSGLHESQSRLWENLVGRSRPFWEYALPLLRQRFAAQLDGADPEALYRAVNAVSRSLIRTDADELTYNLHVIVRFDLECELLEGKLAVTDLPEAWRERYRNDLGVTSAGDGDGVMQDVHWYSGPIGGAFQGYTIGNVLSAQFFDSARAAHPEIDGEIARGVFTTLHGWLRHNIYRHGRKFTPAELVRRATGAAMTVAPYLDYLRSKYSELYDLG